MSDGPFVAIIGGLMLTAIVGTVAVRCTDIVTGETERERAVVASQKEADRQARAAAQEARRQERLETRENNDRRLEMLRTAPLPEHPAERMLDRVIPRQRTSP